MFNVFAFRGWTGKRLLSNHLLLTWRIPEDRVTSTRSGGGIGQTRCSWVSDSDGQAAEARSCSSAVGGQPKKKEKNMLHPGVLHPSMKSRLTIKGKVQLMFCWNFSLGFFFPEQLTSECFLITCPRKMHWSHSGFIWVYCGFGKEWSVVGICLTSCCIQQLQIFFFFLSFFFNFFFIFLCLAFYVQAANILSSQRTNKS